MTTLLLITASPHSLAAKKAVATAKSLLDGQQSISVFFYGDGAYTANRLMWQTADVPSVSDEWVNLANTHHIDLPVCVSTALARGVTDSDNAKRHNLDGDNLRTPFRLVGLSELALQLGDATTVMQF